MNKKPALTADTAFAALLVLFTFAVIFSGLFPDDLLYNVILAGVSCVILLLTYFAGLTAGLVANALLVFAAITYVFYLVYFKGDALPPYTWFWPILTPLLTVCVAAFSRASLGLEQKLADLQEKYDDYVVVDESCGLKTRRAMLQDCDTYMRLAERFDHQLTLAVIEVEHGPDIERLVPHAQVDTLVDEISAILCSRLRAEDQAYILDRKTLCWGLLLLTQKDTSAEPAAQRLRSQIEDLHVSGGPKRREVLIKMDYGACEFRPKSGQLPADLLAAAEKDLVYHA